ncbi:hypothetical protein Q8W34_17230 [Pseudoalteromonas marina]|uniref:Myb-like domain-containing protein n=2 Tax=Pseudoalteromonas marina TaxID=267375 RepID=A0ABT9FHX2_9GAMM|nr:hypothetical protein [Pseudoalteromonas marina]
MNNNGWTAEENEILMQSIENNYSISEIIKQTSEKIKRSEKSIERRLIKIGYMSKSKQNFSRKKGFVG